ncbi:MAG: IS1634 family transposase [Planctomycetota bacterium]
MTHLVSFFRVDFISRDSIAAHAPAPYRVGMEPKTNRPKPATDPAKLAPKASGGDMTLHSRTLGVLPIINQVIDRLQLKPTLDHFLPQEDRRSKITTATALLILVRNILLSREPLYGLGQWAADYVPELLGLHERQLKSLNDDRVGRALDRLFDANLPELTMAVTRNIVDQYKLDLSELHNDSTTVRFYGDYDEFEEPVLRRGKTTVAIRRGRSKDHRPDLKQLLYILTVSNDGGVPVYFTTDDGDKPDDRTHIPTWDLLHQLTGRVDFLYVADCKLASSGNLKHIHQLGGRFITILPKNRSEAKKMQRTLTDSPEALSWQLLYENHDEEGNLVNRFKTLREEQLSADGYRLLWIHSMVKAVTDDGSRVKAINKTIEELTALKARLRSPRTRTRERHRVETEVEKILSKRKMSDLIVVEIIEEEEAKLKQTTPGRRSAKTEYTREVKLRFDLHWNLDTERLELARRADGVFPLITNDLALSAEEVLRAYKRQPIIEKRFSQLKTDFNVAPVFLKEASRIESLLCVYFLCLVIQTLMERELRGAMADSGLASLPLYPEGRACSRPTARRIIDAMASLSRHRLVTEEGDALDLHTDPTPLQRQLMKLYGIKNSEYGK